jgi:hypothetical protein
MLLSSEFDVAKTLIIKARSSDVVYKKKDSPSDFCIFLRDVLIEQTIMSSILAADLFSVHGMIFVVTGGGSGKPIRSLDQL